MSAPSLLHESRVEVLEDLANLAGYTVKIDLYGGLRPDVSRLHRARRSILIADAKATEQPEDPATRARLLKYVTAARKWDRAGFTVALAVCHGADPAERWVSSVASLVAVARCTVTRSTLAVLDLDTTVSAVSFHPASGQSLSGALLPTLACS